MNKGFGIAFIWLLMTTGQATAQATPPAAEGPYVAIQGSINGQPTTIMVDEKTGATWYLGTVDAQGHAYLVVPLGQSIGTPTWLPVQVAQQPKQSN